MASSFLIKYFFKCGWRVVGVFIPAISFSLVFSLEDLFFFIDNEFAPYFFELLSEAGREWQDMSNF